MTFLAYVLIVLIPLSAFITIALAVRPGRPTPGRGVPTPGIESRIREIDALGQRPADSRTTRGLQRERKKLHAELLRRGLGR